MRTMCSREIFTKKCWQQQIFDSDLKGAWHYNHVTFTQIAKNFMLYCRLICMLSILCVRLTIKVKVGKLESFKVGWYPPPPQKKNWVESPLLMKVQRLNRAQQSGVGHDVRLNLTFLANEVVLSGFVTGTRFRYPKRNF